MRARTSRSIKAREPIFEDDLVDVDELVFEGVEFPEDAAIVCIFSARWRKGLFFDFVPLGPDRERRDFNVAKQLGSYVAYLYSQGVFHLVDDDWTHLISQQWFPFVSLPASLRGKVARFAKGRRRLDTLLPEAATAARAALPRMLERWRASYLLAPHIDLLARAAERFAAGDYISATAIIYPRIEGIMQTVPSGAAFGRQGKPNEPRVRRDPCACERTSRV